MGEKVPQDLLKGVFYDFQQNHHLMPEQMGIKAGANSKQAEKTRQQLRGGVLQNDLWKLLYAVCFIVLGVGTLNQDDIHRSVDKTMASTGTGTIYLCCCNQNLYKLFEKYIIK